MAASCITTTITAIAIVLLSILYRWLISLFPHSGQGKPPMFGDYEAQRHWMEITYNLNARDWYVNSSHNDLNYWGLDYPPLTAYHSYAMGFVANKINPKFVSLFDSRGIETLEHKLWMRTTVLIADLLVFYPSVFLVLRSPLLAANKQAATTAAAADGLMALFLVLVNPTLALIDHGHFQYNSLSLGLAQLAIACILAADRRRSNWLLYASAALFTMALNYKQMELYHALPFFFYLLGVCLKQESIAGKLVKLAAIGATVVVSFLVIWAPFLDTKLELALQVLHRIFPFSRGLFEDKVANFWCSLSVVVKLKQMFSVDMLSKISLLVTALLNLPSGLDLLARPGKLRFLLAIVNSSLVFFLFSFQVHEKSILLATVPACLLINKYPFLTVWFMTIANLSMLPLLVKDGLVIAYACSTHIFLAIALYYYYSTRATDTDRRVVTFWPTLPLPGLSKLAFAASMTGALTLTLLILFVKPPGRLPDLWTVAICVYSCAHFVLFALVYHSIQLRGGLDDELETTTAKLKKSQ